MHRTLRFRLVHLKDFQPKCAPSCFNTRNVKSRVANNPMCALPHCMLPKCTSSYNISRSAHFRAACCEVCILVQHLPKCALWVCMLTKCALSYNISRSAHFRAACCKVYILVQHLPTCTRWACMLPKCAFSCNIAQRAYFGMARCQSVQFRATSPRVHTFVLHVPSATSTFALHHPE